MVLVNTGIETLIVAGFFSLAAGLRATVRGIQPSSIRGATGGAPSGHAAWISTGGRVAGGAAIAAEATSRVMPKARVTDAAALFMRGPPGESEWDWMFEDRAMETRRRQHGCKVPPFDSVYGETEGTPWRCRVSSEASAAGRVPA